jgi:hypothetical protein
MTLRREGVKIPSIRAWTKGRGCEQNQLSLVVGFATAASETQLPARFLSWSGVIEPPTTGAPQLAGMIMVTIGTAIALWCVFTFVFIWKGTPAPFDPPRKLVIRNHEWTLIHTNGGRGF